MIKNGHGNTVDHLGEIITAGSSISPNHCCARSWGGSCTVVRESVTSLLAKGLFHTGPTVGTRVLPADQRNWLDPDVISWQSHVGLSPEFIRDLQNLRLMVEPVADRATEADIAEIEGAYAGMRCDVMGGGDYVTSDLRFHQGLLRISFEVATRKKDGPRSSLPLHRALLNAVIARNPAKAERAVMVVIDRERKDIEQVLCSRRRLPRVHQHASPPLKAA